MSAESSLFYWADVKTLKAALTGMLRGRFTMKMSRGPFGLPADLLIAKSGEVLAVKYGKTAYDQWTVDELLTLARQARDHGHVP